MNKAKEIFTIAFVFAFFIGAGVLTYFYGVKSHDIHYIRLEVNPKVEFLTTDDNRVTSVYPLNSHAEMLLTDENFVGIDIKDACQKFLDLCVKANYIDVDGEDNTVRITVVAGFMQALEMQVYESLNNYLIKNNILTMIVENDSDRTEVTDAKDNDVTSPNKLALIKSIMQQDTKEHEFKTLNGKTETELILMIKKIHEKNVSPPTEEQRTQKTQLLNANRHRVERHLAKVTDATTRNFHKTYDEFKRENTNKYELDFDAIYNQNFPDEQDDDEMLKEE